MSYDLNIDVLSFPHSLVDLFLVHFPLAFWSNEVFLQSHLDLAIDILRQFVFFFGVELSGSHTWSPSQSHGPSIFSDVSPSRINLADRFLRLPALDEGVLCHRLVHFLSRQWLFYAGREVILPNILLIFVLEIKDSERLSWDNFPSNFILDKFLAGCGREINPFGRELLPSNVRLNLRLLINFFFVVAKKALESVLSELFPLLVNPLLVTHRLYCLNSIKLLEV